MCADAQRNRDVLSDRAYLIHPHRSIATNWLLIHLLTRLLYHHAPPFTLPERFTLFQQRPHFAPKEEKSSVMNNEILAFPIFFVVYCLHGRKKTLCLEWQSWQQSISDTSEVKGMLSVNGMWVASSRTAAQCFNIWTSWGKYSRQATTANPILQLHVQSRILKLPIWEKTSTGCR